MKAFVKAVLAATLFTTTTAATAHDMVPAGPQTEPVLLQNGTVYTITNGVLENADVLFDDGKIVAVGTDLEVPAQAQVIDITGKHVYPGLIALDTTLGLVEIGAVRASDDQNEVGAITPEVSGHIAYNPDSEIIPTVRYNGVTHAEVVPQGELIMGRSSLLKTDGWTYEDSAESLNVALHVNWPRAGLNTAWWERRSPAEQRKANAEALQRLKDAFTEARAYYDAKLAGETNGTDLRWEAMSDLFTGTIQLFVHADDKRQIEQAVEFSKEYGFDLVIVGGRDAWRVTELLATEQVPVIYGAMYGLPTRDDEPYDQAYRTPALLAQAGVDFALAYPGYWDVRNLAFGAGNSVAYGLDREAALAAITLKPAQLMGVDAELGSIEVGKNASLIVSDGDILDHREHGVELMFIDGGRVDLNNRHLQLYNKYKQKP